MRRILFLVALFVAASFATGCGDDKTTSKGVTNASGSVVGSVTLTK